MVGRKFIAIIAGLVAFTAALAVAALIYIDWNGMLLPQTASQGPAASDIAPAPSAEPKTGAEEEPKPQAEATGALTPPAERTSVPTFDVVVIEPNGEGVIAGRAAPGWQVSVQSGGVKVAEAKADVQGEWSVVLEKPLPKGDHALSLKITSPDGTQAVSSQESVRVAVGIDEKKPSPPVAEVAPKPAETSPQVAAPAPPANDAAAQPAPQAEAAAAPDTTERDGPRALARSEQTAPSSTDAAPRPTLVFKTVDYQDTGPDTGVVTLTGTSNPGATIQIYYGNQPVAQTRADRDGTWQAAIVMKLGTGVHGFRAERIDAAGAPSGRAKVAIERMEPKPKGPEVTAEGGAPAQVAAVEPSSPATQNESATVYIIRRGDTLWAIAKRYLGSGLRYTSIFQDNRAIIRNPDLIHPKQEVKVPQN